MAGGDIKPGGEWFEKVYVHEYCRFDEPGTYTVRAFHDLGYGPQRTNDPRVVETTIKILATTEQDTRRILAEEENAKPDYGPTWGKKGKSRLDYRCIRWPAFLRPLQERARHGNENALDGIGSIRTLDASAALVDLLQHTNAEFAAKAAKLIEPRLPHPESAFTGPWGAERRQFIITNSWNESLSPSVRKFCARLLAGTDRGDFLTATSLLSLIGKSEDLPAIRNALEVAVAGTNAEYLFEIHYPAPIRAADSLVGAALTINSNLDVEASETLSPGNLLVFLARHGGGDKVLSPDERAMFARGLQHSLPYLRMKAIECLPNNVPPSLSDLIAQRMTDTYEGVQTYAFETARRMNDPRHRDLALSVLKKAENEWLQRAANDIALKYNARYDAVTIWASRIAAPQDMNDYLPHHIIQHLFDIIVGPNVGGNLVVPKKFDSAQKMREDWLHFLEANRSKIEHGDIFRIADLPHGLGIHSSDSSGVSVSPERE